MQRSYMHVRAPSRPKRGPPVSVVGMVVVASVAVAGVLVEVDDVLGNPLIVPFHDGAAWRIHPG